MSPVTERRRRRRPSPSAFSMRSSRPPEAATSPDSRVSSFSGTARAARRHGPSRPSPPSGPLLATPEQEDTMSFNLDAALTGESMFGKRTGDGARPSWEEIANLAYH